MESERVVYMARSKRLRRPPNWMADGAARAKSTALAHQVLFDINVSLALCVRAMLWCVCVCVSVFSYIRFIAYRT